MVRYRLTTHAQGKLAKGDISEAWLQLALTTPDTIYAEEDGTVHYIRRIPEFGNRHPRVVVNPGTTPHTIVTVLFDRRLRRA